MYNTCKSKTKQSHNQNHNRVHVCIYIYIYIFEQGHLFFPVYTYRGGAYSEGVQIRIGTLIWSFAVIIKMYFPAATQSEFHAFQRSSG